jgi:Resolvase, N terminal domain
MKLNHSVEPESRSLIALTPRLPPEGGKFHHAIGPNAIRSPMDEAFLTACGFQADSVRVLPSLAPNSSALADKKKASGGRTILYARVSTAEQTLAHQRTQAEAAGYRLDEIVADHGVSGISTTRLHRWPRCPTDSKALLN